MGTTPKLAIPYVEPTDQLAVYPTQDKAQADRLEAIWAGTAWTAITASYAGTIFWRQIGSIIFVQIDLTGTFVNGTVYTFGTAPAAIKPLRTARAGADFQGYPGGISVGSASGAVQGRHFAGSDRSGVNGTIVYSVG